MLIVNPLLETWREFQALLSERAKYSTFNLLKELPNNITQYRTVINKPKFLDYLPNYKLTNSSDSVLEVNLDTTLNSLKSDGFFLGMNLQKKLVQEIFKFATNTPCYGNGNKSLEFYYYDQAQIKASDKPLSFANYTNAASVCPGIKKLESDPILLEIAANYLEAKPIHQQSQLWWNFPVKSSIYERRHAVQKFHYHHDYRRLRFVFYITDVDLCSSPHICVRGSHTKKKLAHRFITKGCSQPEIRQYYGYENIVSICGKAGFGFVENPLCFHKENPPGSKDRLTLQIEFATKIPS
ncbi:MAG: hypothetical protein WA828_15940 [Coleofasciculaceae cyanobacterium]